MFKLMPTHLCAGRGFSSIHLNVKMDDIYKYFKKLVNDYEIRAVQQLRT